MQTRLSAVDSASSPATQPTATPGWHVVEIAAVVGLFFVYGGSAAPDVNEAHYLGKAKHFWDATFCGRDFFYQSHDAHAAFFWMIGWLTQFASLEATAWIGRFGGWMLLASGWHLLSFSLVPFRFASVLTAGLWIVLIQQTQMSGEWIIGGIEAKTIAYAFVLLGLRQIVRQQWTTAWILFGVASAVHVLVGGWAVVLAAFGWTSLPSSVRPPWQNHVIGCFVGGLISLIGLLPALRLNVGTAPEISQQAAQIYVNFRLPHHLLLRDFPSQFVLRHMLITAVFLGLFRAMRNDSKIRSLLGFCAGATLLLIMGAAFDASLGGTALGSSILRFYWFRCSDIFLPLAVSIGSVYWVIQYASPRFPRLAAVAITGTTMVIATNACNVVAIAQRNPIPAADRQGGIRGTSRLRHWRDACRWIDEHLPTDAVCLTPTNHQSFKWYASRAEVVTWKDVPQDAQGLTQWYERLQAVRAWRTSPNPTTASRRLSDLRRNYDFDFVVTGWPSTRLSNEMVPIYRNAYYAVHRFAELSTDEP